jgi:hypothetical protein
MHDELVLVTMNLFFVSYISPSAAKKIFANPQWVYLPLAREVNEKLPMDQVFHSLMTGSVS